MAAKRPNPAAKKTAELELSQRVRALKKAAEKQRMLKQLICSDAPEQALRYHGFRVIAGVDEVGRGALFGPVVAAAVILPERTTDAGERRVEGFQADDARGS